MMMMSKPETAEAEDAYYAKEGGEGAGRPESVDEEEATNPTALLPLSALGQGVKEGDTVTVRVVKVYDDEAEVELAGADEAPNKEQSMMPGKGMMEEAGDELDSMDRKGM